MDLGCVALDFVDILEVPAEVAALGEGLVADVACEGPLARMLAEVVPQVTTLLENALAASVLAAEIKLDALALLILHLNRLVPLAWHTGEGLARLYSHYFYSLVIILSQLMTIQLLILAQG